MSRIENVLQASGHDRPISHRLQHLPCGKCCAVIEYEQGTEWGVVNELVNEHWKACPRKPHASLAHMARTPTSPPDTAIPLPPPTAQEQSSSSNSAAESVGSPIIPWTSTGCERKRRTLEQRKLELEQDEYAENITTKSVVCRGCHKEISLDKRSKYYPGLWLKHRSKCLRIEKFEVSKSSAGNLGNILTPLKSAKAKVPQALDGTRQVSCDSVVTSAPGDNSYGDALQLGPAERHRSYSAAATHRLVRQCDSEDPSSEDEDGDGDLLPQESFPSESVVLHEYTSH
ncbi:hypothetical protein OG21DRAFT_1311714 [Imleria badia]|nr:hypothetical protein OG21DRAFT_1311714 [Imleria badia]